MRDDATVQVYYGEDKGGDCLVPSFDVGYWTEKFGDTVFLRLCGDKNVGFRGGGLFIGILSG